MVKVLNITISDRNFIFCFAYFFRLRIVHVYFDILSPVYLGLGRLRLSVCLTMIRLLCCHLFQSTLIKFLVKTKLISRIPLLFPYDSRIPSPLKQEILLPLVIKTPASRSCFQLASRVSPRKIAKSRISPNLLWTLLVGYSFNVVTTQRVLSSNALSLTSGFLTTGLLCFKCPTSWKCNYSQKPCDLYFRKCGH